MSWYSPLLKRFVWPVLLSREGRGSALRHEAQLERSQYWSRQRLLDEQWRRLQRLLAIASEHSPYYRRVFRERGLTVDSFKSPEDLTLLPRLTRSEIFTCRDDLLTGLHAPEQVMKFTTGGTTIRAATLFRDQESYNIKLGLAFRHERWAGRRPGGRMLLVWHALMDIVENPPLRTRIKEHILLGQRMLCAGSHAEEALVAGHEILCRYRPSLLKVFPNSLAPLAEFIKSHSLIVPPIDGLISTGEPLSATRRKLFREVFDCPVFDLYASREVGHTACECEAHEGRHIAMETSIVEFVGSDDLPVPPGERGEILVTDLTNTAFPLIRYDIGDKGIALEASCPCGRELVRMGAAVGRVADEGYRPDGTAYSGLTFAYHVFTRGDIGEVQIIQRSLDSYQVLVTREPPPPPQAFEELRAGMRKLLGADVTVAFELVDEILWERSGKKRYFKCELGPEELARVRAGRTS